MCKKTLYQSKSWESEGTCSDAGWVKGDVDFDV